MLLRPAPEKKSSTLALQYSLRNIPFELLYTYSFTLILPIHYTSASSRIFYYKQHCHRKPRWQPHGPSHHVVSSPLRSSHNVPPVVNITRTLRHSAPQRLRADANIRNQQKQRRQQHSQGHAAAAPRLTNQNLQQLRGGAGQQLRGWTSTQHAHEQVSVGTKVVRDERDMRRKLDELQKEINRR